MTGGREVGAVQPGGASSNFIGPDKLDLALDFGTAAKAGTMLGSGAMVVLAEGTDELAAATNVLRFFRNESCGKCVPCRVGSTKAHEILRGVLDEGVPLDGPRRERILELEEVMRKTSICGLGQVALGPVVSVLGLDKGGAAARPQPKPEGGPGAARPSEPGASSSRRSPSPRRWPASGRRGAPAAESVPREDAAAPGARGRRRSPRTRCPASPASTVDGYAVRAADTYGASDGLPAYLDWPAASGWGARRMWRCRRTARSRYPPARCCPTEPTRW